MKTKSQKRKLTMIKRFMDEYQLSFEEAEDLYMQWHSLIAVNPQQSHKRHFDNPANATKAVKKRWRK